MAILIAQLLGLLIIFRGERSSRRPDQTSPAPPAEDGPSSPDAAESSDGSDSSKGSVANENTSPSFRGASYVSSEGGYRFRYPRNWDIEPAGTATEVTSPTMKAIVAFGLAPSGNLRSATRRSVALIQDQHGDVIVTEVASQQIAGRPARVVDGKATNTQGVRLWFRLVTIAGRNDVFAILAFEAADQSDPKMSPELEDIIDTFREVRSTSGSVSAAPVPGLSVVAERSAA